MTAYYNENDADAVAALRQLISDGVIAPGDVDDRSIKDVKASELKGYTQHHFFAGGGLWSVACRLAGWPDERPIWTASCPCQPFSNAGRRRGARDPRHLWPDLFRILRAARAAGHGPAVIMGEQVSGSRGYRWFDGVRADLAKEAYAARARDLPACALDAPIERNRLWWIAVAGAGGRIGERAGFRQGGTLEHRAPSGNGDGRDGVVASSAGARREHAEDAQATGETARAEHKADEGRAAGTVQSQRQDDARGSLGRAAGARRQGLAGAERCESGPPRRADAQRADGRNGRQGDVGCADGTPARRNRGRVLEPQAESASKRQEPRDFADRPGHADDRDFRAVGRSNGAREFQRQGHVADERRWPGHTDARRNGSWWADGEWIVCHDGKARRAKPGVPLLVDGLPGRVAAWRLIGNAISPIVAAEVIAAFLEAEVRAE